LVPDKPKPMSKPPAEERTTPVLKKVVEFRSPSAPPSKEVVFMFSKQTKSNQSLLERFMTPCPQVPKETPSLQLKKTQEGLDSSLFLDPNYISHVYERCLDMSGSKNVQYLLDTLKFNEKKSLINALIPHTDILMMDIFGNYVVQKIIELGTDDQRDIVIKHMSGHISRMALDNHGCRVLQKALEELKNVPMFVQKVVFHLKDETHMLMRHQNGNHVLQKLIDILPLAQHSFLMEATLEHVCQKSSI
jgi:Pumilio-family RNA binding repeat